MVNTREKRYAPLRTKKGGPPESSPPSVLSIETLYTQFPGSRGRKGRRFMSFLRDAPELALARRSTGEEGTPRPGRTTPYLRMVCLSGRPARSPACDLADATK